MSQPVWVLSVDLQTKTATFQSGMAEAARSARGAFTEIQEGSGAMGRSVGSNMFEARHTVMALGDEFGVTLPRALTAFISSIGPVGAALEAAFPFASIALGAYLVLQHLAKMREEGEKLTEDQQKLGIAAASALGQLDQKLLQAGIRADELRNNHLGALQKQLELIDKQSMDELVQAFSAVAKAADATFGDLKTSWYQFGIGSAGAQHALSDFRNQYELLLKQGKDGEAADLLKGTRESAEKVLALQKQAHDASASQDSKEGEYDEGDQAKIAAATAELKKAGVGYTEKELAAQQALVTALQQQSSIEEKVNALKGLDKGNAKGEVDKEASGRQAEAARQAAEMTTKVQQSAIAEERSLSEASLAAKHASIAERLTADTKFADDDYRVQLAGIGRQIEALDKYDKDYTNKLKALQDRAVELTAQHNATIAGLNAKASEELARKSETDLEASIREKLAVTQSGDAARLAVIQEGIRTEEAAGLQSTSFYRELLDMRVEESRKAAEEQAKVQAEEAKEAAENTQKMGELALAAEREQEALADSAHRMTVQRRIAESVQAEDEEFAVKMQAAQQEAAALDKNAKDYEAKLKANQDKEAQLVQEHENKITQIQDQAEMERNQRIMAAEDQLRDHIAANLTQTIMGQKSFASTMVSLGDTVVSGMFQNAIKSVLANDMTKESDAAAAARKAFLAGMSFPFPTNIVMAPVLGAAAFASVMAFETGTDGVPGVTKGDTVPAMLTPGEGVVPGGVMDGLRNVAKNGGFDGGGPHYHAHVAPVYHVQALDAAGFDAVLKKNSQTLTKHVNNELRKMNR